MTFAAGERHSLTSRYYHVPPLPFSMQRIGCRRPTNEVPPVTSAHGAASVSTENLAGPGATVPAAVEPREDELTEGPPTADSVSPPQQRSASPDDTADHATSTPRRRLRPCVSPGLTAVATTAAAAFPTIYQLDPELATRPGVWNWARWYVFVLWCAFILVVAFQIAMNQAKDGARLERTAKRTSSRVNESIELANAQFVRNIGSWQKNVEQMSEISKSLAKTAVELSDMQFRMDLAAAQRSIDATLREAATLPIDGLDPLPPNPIVVVTVMVNRTGEQRLFLPDLELLDATAEQSRTLTTLLGLDAPRGPSQMMRIELDNRMKNYLPGWRERDIAFVVPLLRQARPVPVGSLVVVLSRAGAEGAKPRTIDERCRNMAENIQLSVERISDQLCGDDRQASEGER